MVPRAYGTNGPERGMPLYRFVEGPMNFWILHPGYLPWMGTNNGLSSMSDASDENIASSYNGGTLGIFNVVAPLLLNGSGEQSLSQ